MDTIEVVEHQTNDEYMKKIHATHIKRRLKRPPKWNALNHEVRYAIKLLLAQEIGSIIRLIPSQRETNAFVSLVRQVNYWVFKHGIRKCIRAYGVNTCIVDDVYKLHRQNQLSYAFTAPSSTEPVNEVLILENSEYKISRVFRSKLPEELKDIINTKPKSDVFINDYEYDDINDEELEVTPVIKDEVEHHHQNVIPSSQISSINLNFGNLIDRDIITTIHTLNSMNLLNDSIVTDLNEKIIEMLFDVNIVQAIIDQGK